MCSHQDPLQEDFKCFSFQCKIDFILYLLINYTCMSESLNKNPNFLVATNMHLLLILGSLLLQLFFNQFNFQLCWHCCPLFFSFFICVIITWSISEAFMDAEETTLVHEIHTIKLLKHPNWALPTAMIKLFNMLKLIFKNWDSWPVTVLNTKPKGGFFNHNRNNRVLRSYFPSCVWVIFLN